MKGKDVIRKLEPGNIGAAFRQEDHPLFIACLKKGSDYHVNLKHLEEVSAFFEDSISVCFILDDLFTYFKDRYGISGTPTFLVIKNGEILGTLLGKNPANSLIEFAKECLSRCSPLTAPESGQKRAVNYEHRLLTKKNYRIS